MGLLDSTSQKNYYTNSDNTQNEGRGDYQFVTLDHIISSFMAIYVGENKIINIF